MSETDQTQAQVKAALVAAFEAKKAAGNQQIQALKTQSLADQKPPNEDCGGATVFVQLDGRSTLARAMKKSAPGTGVTIQREPSRRLSGYYRVDANPAFDVDPLVNLQNSSIGKKAAEGMAESLESTLGLKTMVVCHRD